MKLFKGLILSTFLVASTAFLSDVNAQYLPPHSCYAAQGACAMDQGNFHYLWCDAGSCGWTCMGALYGTWGGVCFINGY